MANGDHNESAGLQSSINRANEPKQICLSCFQLIPLEVRNCPYCKADIAELTAHGYRAKLLHALFHPSADVRMRVTFVLGWLGEPDVADDLAACAMRNPLDVVGALEIIKSLVMLKESKSVPMALSVLQNSHPAHAVREAANIALDGLDYQK